jgi:acyl-CoA reductase-like NAD-dependent aldehyde dehydrogenase
MPKTFKKPTFEKALPLYLGNKALVNEEHSPVYCKYSGDEIATVCVATKSDIKTAISRAVTAAPSMAALRPYERREILKFCYDEIKVRQDEFSEVICLEAGKPIKQARGEVKRALDTFSIAAEEAVRPVEESINLEREERYSGKRALIRRFPRGVCSFITPFNFPLNLVAHKVAPAIAAGCPFIMKPSSQTPVSALMLAEIFSRTSLPTGAFSVLPCPSERAAAFVEDSRISFLSFTGSGEVGWDIKSRAGKKKVALELGGNAACIVDEGVSLQAIVPKILSAAFGYAGQSCISVQRIIVLTSIYPALLEELIEGAKALKVGNPHLEDTEVGPLISEKEAQRVESWVNEALANGARLACGGQRNGSFFSPTLLEDVPSGQAVLDEEVFGPVAVIQRVKDMDAALAEVNRSKFGLQAGIFTEKLPLALSAWEALQVGAVIIGDVPTWRADLMPYGGVKESGFGREGVPSAIKSMTEERLLIF